MSDYFNSKPTNSSFRDEFRRVNPYPSTWTVMSKFSLKWKIIFTPEKVGCCIFEIFFFLNELKLTFAYFSVIYTSHFSSY